MIVAGTAGVVYPAAGLPGNRRRARRRIIDINPELSEISRLADWHLEGTSAYWLRAVKGER
jgi:NAD-dependent deacetylase